MIARAGKRLILILERLVNGKWKIGGEWRLESSATKFNKFSFCCRGV